MERKPKGRRGHSPSFKETARCFTEEDQGSGPSATSPPSKKWQGALKGKAKVWVIFPKSLPLLQKKPRGALKTKAPGNPDIRITKRVRVAKEADVNKDAEEHRFGRI
ncbi:hypothetical protein M422DRAFT_273982 [Sphaerobolus stellatus SS14]|uniref:Unplaced genomic scaffold SPHSTscaffold_359, whole genome shotgun sequence n=1 Tax=Sphaerobolus stellatus (strain SS14) TaxID=990650 RepID=A0A0C9T7U0_SPHS4|nr:hypothetical protein M422DRAFT_273982 [Sphaerobolus stellatus SS14]